MTGIRANSLDHVALWVSDRDQLAHFLCGHLGMHVIERGVDFTLVGVDAKEGKLTLFDADGPREPGVLERVALRVGDLEAALAELPEEIEVERHEDRGEFTAPQGLRIALVEGDGLDYDLDHVVLRTREPEPTAARLAELGFERRNGALSVADRELVLNGGGSTEVERPLLNHLALLVDSVAEIDVAAQRQGFEVVKRVDAENTLAVFVEGPDGIVVEFVEHKPGFSLK